MGWWKLSFRNELIIIIASLSVATILLVLAITCLVVRWKRRRKAKAAQEQLEEEKQKMLDESSCDEILMDDIGSADDLTSKKKSKRKLRWKTIARIFRKLKRTSSKEKSESKQVELIEVAIDAGVEHMEPIQLVDVDICEKAVEADNVDVSEANITENKIDPSKDDVTGDVIFTDDPEVETVDIPYAHTPASYKSYSLEKARKEIVRQGHQFSFASRAKLLVEYKLSAGMIIGTLKSCQGLIKEDVDSPQQFCVQIDTSPAPPNTKPGFVSRWYEAGCRQLMTSFIVPYESEMEKIHAQIIGRKRAFGPKRCYGVASFSIVELKESQQVTKETTFLPEPMKIKKDIF